MTSGSAALAMEKEVQPKKEVAPLSELAAKKIALQLWKSFKQDPALALKELNSYIAKSSPPQDVISQIINFNLQNIDNNASKTFLLAAFNNIKLNNLELEKVISDPSNAIENITKAFDLNEITLEKNITFIKRLLELGADVHVKGVLYRTALNLALINLPENQESLSVLQLLITAGADVNDYRIITNAVTKPMFMEFLIKQPGFVINRILTWNQEPITPLEMVGRLGEILSTEKNKIWESFRILRKNGGKTYSELKK